LKITFILPTFNRKNFVARAVESCLEINKNSKNIKATVLVLDGYSDDGAWEMLQKKYNDNRNVILKQIDKKLGFQETAFFGVNQVKTDYCTFMYNDDIISKYFFLVADKLKNNDQNFIMGYGKNANINSVYKFRKPIFKKIHTQKIILNYFGSFKSLKYTSLPVSPVPSISKTIILKKWIKEIRVFVKKSNFRKDMMIKQNIGPDLIIYLYNLMLMNKKIVFCNSTIAQLSHHKESMSVIYGKQPLATGYWLSRIWYFEKYLNKKKNIDLLFSSKLSSYIIVSGFYIFIINILNFNFRYSLSIISEITNTIKLCLINKFLLKTIFELHIVITNRIQRNKFLLTPN